MAEVSHICIPRAVGAAGPKGKQLRAIPSDVDALKWEELCPKYLHIFSDLPSHKIQHFAF